MGDFGKRTGNARQEPPPRYTSGAPQESALSDQLSQRELTALEETASQRFVPQLALATAYAGLGDFDRAFAALAKSFDETDNWLRLAWWNPALFELRADPRMRALMKRMGLEITS